MGHAQHHHHGEGDEPYAGEHGRTDAYHLLDRAMDAEPHDDPMQRYRNDDRLEQKGDRRGDIEVRRILDERLPGDRGREHQRMRRETR